MQREKNCSHHLKFDRITALLGKSFTFYFVNVSADNHVLMITI